MPSFKLFSEFTPKGDQPNAITTLTQRILSGKKHHVLLGVTGSGKTFTMANVIAKVGKPTLVIAPNKTLAAQLYNEFRLLFPENAVEYFVSLSLIHISEPTRHTSQSRIPSYACK